MEVEPPVRMKALVLDDDEEALAFAAEVLSSFAPGFDVATARDLEEAILWLGVFHPNLLLLEPRLCGDNLVAITSALQADQRSQNCRIIMMSGAGSPEHHDGQTRMGAHAVLGKPLRLQELLSTVQAVVGGPSRFDGRVALQPARQDLG
jgi:DNA-binding response OmpR family regulator